MKKSQYADYLRMLKRREQLSVTADTNPEAAKELKEMEESPEEKQARRGIKELTKEFDNLPE